MVKKNCREKYLALFIIAILLNLSLLCAVDLYYRIEVYYDNGIMNIDKVDIKPHDWKMENFYKPYQFDENIMKIVDFEDRTIQEEKFSVPSFGVYDTVDKNGEINGGGSLESENFTFYIYAPYIKNAKEIIIYDSEKNELTKKEISEYSQVFVSDKEDFNEVKEESKDNFSYYYDNLKENIKQYWVLILILFFIVLIVIYYLFSNKQAQVRFIKLKRFLYS